MDPVLYGPREGEHRDAESVQIVIKAAGEHTGGAFFLDESTGRLGLPVRRRTATANGRQIAKVAVRHILTLSYRVP
jgi:hypothetical protein